MNHRIVSAMVFLALCGPLGTVSAATLEIVYPSDKTYFPRSDYLIIKGGDSPALDAIELEFNGEAQGQIDISGADFRAAFGDLILLQPEFSPGRNLVKVDGLAGGKKVATAAADVYYLDGDKTAVPPSDYAPFVMHLPEKEAKCALCHNMTPDAVELKVEDAGSNPCASCHLRMLNQEHVHGPAGVYRCSYCHDAQSRPAKYQVRAHDAELCNECHLGKVQDFNRNKFVHGPVGVGLCSVCHDSHASAYSAQLVAPTNQVCLGCHEGIKDSPHVVRGVSGKSHPLSDVPDPSRPGAMLTCASCHDPHGGNGRSFFRGGITSRFALCQMCHAK